MIPPTWYAIAALVATNLLTGYLWRMDAHELRLIELRGEIAQKDNELHLERQRQITEDTTNGWKAALDTTRADYDRRLRLAGRSPMPGISGPAGGVDGLPTDSLALAAQCAETTLNYESLQRWVDKQRNAK